VRCYVEPSPAGGYFVRLRGESAPLSRHDTEEEAEAAAAAYERGLARSDTGENVTLDDGAEVLVRELDDEAIGAFADGRAVASARYVPEAARPHVAEVIVTVDEAWRDRGLDGKLLRRLAERASENRIRTFVIDGAEQPVGDR
jgi:GNAT superfamily N-acetyltransferase